jgi:hypothetical protein
LDYLKEARLTRQSAASVEPTSAAPRFDSDNAAMLSNFSIVADRSSTLQSSPEFLEKKFNPLTGEGMGATYSIDWHGENAQRLSELGLFHRDGRSPQSLADAIGDGMLTHDERANLYNELLNRHTHEGSWGAGQLVRDLNARLGASHSNFRIFQVDSNTPDCRYEIRNINTGDRSDDVTVRPGDAQPKPTLNDMALNAALALADGKLKPGEEGALAVLSAAYNDGRGERLTEVVGRINSLLSSFGSRYQLDAQVAYSPGPPIEKQPYRSISIKPTVNDSFTHASTVLPHVSTGMDDRFELWESTLHSDVWRSFSQ